MCTTIQKFCPEEKGDRDPLLSDRRNIVVIADEAHRSQYDFIDGYARHMRDALPNALFIGFTGTPIELADASTRAVFGDHISVYGIQRAVDDEATVPMITTLRAPTIRKLVNAGAVTASLFDQRNLAEITSDEFRGERLIVSRNPPLAAERQRKRDELLAATDKELEPIVAATRRSNQPLRGAADIGIRVGKVINRYKMGEALRDRHHRRALHLSPRRGEDRRRLIICPERPRPRMLTVFPEGGRQRAGDDRAVAGSGDGDVSERVRQLADVAGSGLRRRAAQRGVVLRLRGVGRHGAPHAASAADRRPARGAEKVVSDSPGHHVRRTRRIMGCVSSNVPTCGRA